MCLRYEFPSEWETVVLNKLHWIAVMNNENKSVSHVNSRCEWFPLLIEQGQSCVLELKQSNSLDHKNPWQSFLVNELAALLRLCYLQFSFLLFLSADAYFMLWLSILPTGICVVPEVSPPVRHPDIEVASNIVIKKRLWNHNAQVQIPTSVFIMHPCIVLNHSELLFHCL